MIHEHKIKLSYIVSSMSSWVGGDPVSKREKGREGKRKDKTKEKRGKKTGCIKIRAEKNQDLFS